MLTWIRGLFAPKSSAERTTADAKPKLTNRLSSLQPLSKDNSHGLPSTSARLPGEEPTVVSFRVRVPVQPADTSSTSAGRQPNSSPRSADTVARHEPPETLAQARLGTAAQRRQLAQAGIVSLDDLRRCRPRQLAAAAKLPTAAAKHLQRWKKMLRLCDTLRDMNFVEARLLFSVYRRTVADLSRATPARLTADLERLCWSSQGRRILGHHRCPTQQQVAAWIAEAKQRINGAPNA